MKPTPEDRTDAQVPFEDMVAAILKVDPEGIAGSKRGKKKDEDEMPSDNTPTDTDT